MLYLSHFRFFLFVFYAIYVCSEVILLQNSCIIFPTVELFVLYNSLFSASLNPLKRNGLTVRNIGKNSIRFLLRWFVIIVNCPYPPTLPYPPFPPCPPPFPLLRVRSTLFLRIFIKRGPFNGETKRNKFSTFYGYIMFYSNTLYYNL